MSNAIGGKWSHEFIGDSHKFFHDLDQYERHYSSLGILCSSHGNYLQWLIFIVWSQFKIPFPKLRHEFGVSKLL